MLYCLKHADRNAELFARLGVLHCEIERALHAADHFGNQRYSGDVAGLRQRGWITQLLCWSIDELHGIQLARSVHAVHWLDVDTGRLGFNDENTVSTNNKDRSSPVGVRNKKIRSSEPTTDTRHLGVRRVPTRTRFEKINRGTRFPIPNRLQIFFLLLVRTTALHNS